MTTLFLDPFSGIAGNMAVGSLLDLGADPDLLRHVLRSIPFSEGRLEFLVEKRLSQGIAGTYFNTIDDEELHHNHTHPHDQEPPSGADHAHEHHHPHSHSGLSPHRPLKAGSKKSVAKSLLKKVVLSRQVRESEEAAPYHAEAHVHGPHRGLPEIRALLKKADLHPTARKLALDCFKALAEAEGRVHGKPADEVHFHEVGARDSIADLVGVAALIHDLGVTRIYTGPVHLGSGWIHCQHGRLPVPAPATALLLEGLPVFQLPGIVGELTTPTGAAILRGLQAQPGLPPGFTYRKCGFGLGSKTFPIPNVLRAFLSTNTQGASHLETVALLETHLDNVTGELLGHVMETIMEHGALDVSLTPMLMKKGRPGFRLSVLCAPSQLESCETLLYRELPTLGIRRQLLLRSSLDRKESMASIDGQSLPAKEIRNHNGTSRTVLEFASRKRLARKLKIPVRDTPESLARPAKGTRKTKKDV